MKLKTVALARQILADVPREDVEELITLLRYYNRFATHDRVKAMRVGSGEPQNRTLEAEIMEGLEKSAGSQNVYMSTSEDYCRLCGKPK